MKLILIFIITTFTFFEVSADENSNPLLDTYISLVKENSYDEIEKYFTNDFVKETKTYFKEKCGILCLVGIDDSWNSEYYDFLESSVLAKRNRSFQYSEEEYNGSTAILNIYSKKSSKGVRKETVYFIKEKNWRINKIKISLNSN